MFLASIIERVSGKSFEDFIRTDLLPRAGKSLFVLDSAADVSRIVPSFRKDEKNGRWEPYKFGYHKKTMETTYGDGGVCGTAEELHAWGEALLKGEVINSQSLKRVWEPGKLGNGDTFPYGFGWRLAPEKDLYYHGGGNMGFYNLFALYPEKKKTLILLSNSNLQNDIAVIFKAIEKLMLDAA